MLEVSLSVMRSLISIVSILWLLLSIVTVVHSKFTAKEKMDIMKMNMEAIRKNLGGLVTKTNNKPTYNCRQQGPGDISDVGDIALRSVQFGPSNDASTWQILGSSIRDVKTSFLNMYDRQNSSSCGTLNTPMITTTTTTTTTTTIYPDLQNSTQIIASTINNPECSSVEFRCGDGTCIPRYWLCDAQEDCQDCSDEKNCTKDDMNARTCPGHMVQCSKSVNCIQRDWLCDGDRDCPHGDDEENCSGGGVGTTPPPTYGPGDIPCDAAGGLPVPGYYRCDGTTDCDDCMDEYQCVECPATFSAVGHQCLHIDEVKRTWEEASMHCQRRGGRLAEPKDLKALKCFMKEKEGLRARYWVGGSAVEGRWLWSGGAAVPLRLLPSGVRHQSLNNRHQQQTGSQSLNNRHQQQTGSDRNCLDVMPRRTRSPFNISNCHTKFRSLCQIEHIN